jgi:ATP-binding cassette, subfamily F, member 1
MHYNKHSLTCNPLATLALTNSLRYCFIAYSDNMHTTTANHLDLHAVLWLDDYLSRWRNTLVIVSHDAHFLDAVCTDIVHLNHAALHYYGAGVDAFRAMASQTDVQQQRAYKQQQKELSAAKRKGLSSADAAAAVLGNSNSSNSSSSRALLPKPRDYTVNFALESPDDCGGDSARFPCISVLDAGFTGYTTSDTTAATSDYGSSSGVSTAERSTAGAGTVRNMSSRLHLFKDLRFKVDASSRVCLIGPNGKDIQYIQ